MKRITGRRMASSLVLVSLLSIVSACTRASSEATEKTVELKATAKTVHQNFFDASLKPVLTINSGDTVRLETATGNPKYFEEHGVPKDKIPQELYTAFNGLPYDVSGPDRGRADATLDGPIKVNGAAPGMSLRSASNRSRFGYRSPPKVSCRIAGC